MPIRIDRVTTNPDGGIQIDFTKFGQGQAGNPTGDGRFYGGGLAEIQAAAAAAVVQKAELEFSLALADYLATHNNTIDGLSGSVLQTP